MGPREEDNAMVLLVTVSLICATWVGVLHAGQTNPAAASPTVMASDEPVRVVQPFIPNMTPSQR